MQAFLCMFPLQVNLIKEEVWVQLLTGLFIGLGLRACGFRVFVPMLGVSLAHRAGHLELGSGFEWLSSDLAMIALLIATIIEVAAYFVHGLIIY